MTNEELDQARVDEAFRVIKENARKNLSLEVARLAREGWMPLEAVDPDEAEALLLWDAFNNEEIEGLDDLVLEAIKRGRELERAALQPKEGEG
jgi:hypothetical protein